MLGKQLNVDLDIIPSINNIVVDHFVAFTCHRQKVFQRTAKCPTWFMTDEGCL